jgi:hypothetical protein
MGAPATYADVRLPEQYTTTTNSQQFLQYDNVQNAENRMLVFYSPANLERLANAQTFFQAAVSFAMMLVSGGRNSPGGLQRRYRP